MLPLCRDGDGDSVALAMSMNDWTTKLVEAKSNVDESSHVDSMHANVSWIASKITRDLLIAVLIS